LKKNVFESGVPPNYTKDKYNKFCSQKLILSCYLFISLFLLIIIIQTKVVSYIYSFFLVLLFSHFLKFIFYFK